MIWMVDVLMPGLQRFPLALVKSLASPMLPFDAQSLSLSAGNDRSSETWSVDGSLMERRYDGARDVPTADTGELDLPPRILSR